MIVNSILWWAIKLTNIWYHYFMFHIFWTLHHYGWRGIAVYPLLKMYFSRNYQRNYTRLCMYINMKLYGFADSYFEENLSRMLYNTIWIIPETNIEYTLSSIWCPKRRKPVLIDKVAKDCENLRDFSPSAECHNRQDNRIENLELVHRKDHPSIHFRKWD